MGMTPSNRNTTGTITKYIGSAFDIVKDIAAYLDNRSGTDTFFSDDPPSNATKGDIWYKTSTNEKYTWYICPTNNNTQWVKDN